MAKNNNMTPIIWDLNQNFGSFSMINQGPGGGSLAQMSLLLRENDASWPLIKLILADPTYKRMYLAHCKTIFEENIVNDDYYGRCQTIQALIASDFQNDPNALYTFAQGQSNLTSSIGGGGGPGGGSIIGIKELFDSRKTYLSATTQFIASPPSVTNIDFPINVPANSTFSIHANVSGSTKVLLGYREFEGDRFVKIEMQDDGLNGDGTAGDGVFGATIQANASDLQFYVYAENNDAGIFSPQRAEHEFYTIATTYDIVLNEIQAKNNLTRADQDGEFEDWIELYNNSSNTIDLSAYYLSDKGSQLDRWNFPTGTSLAPDEYIIVWADQDTLQAGLHANFKLSSGGESIYLSDGVTVFDKIKYVYFYTDTAYGRLPNGTGAMTLLKPTFKAHNEGFVAIREYSEGPNFSLYPNPSDQVVSIESDEEITQEIEVFDVLGTLVIKTNKTVLDLSTWSKGVYFVKLGNNTKKLLVK